jgi:hypothetical protein
MPNVVDLEQLPREGFVCTGEDAFTKPGRAGCGGESPPSDAFMERRRLAIAAGWLLWQSALGPLEDPGAALCPSCAWAPSRSPLQTSTEPGADDRVLHGIVMPRGAVDRFVNELFPAAWIRSYHVRAEDAAVARRAA